MGLWHIVFPVIALFLAAAQVAALSSAQATPAAGLAPPASAVTPAQRSAAPHIAPTAPALERRITRSVPLSTLPTAAVYIPDLKGVVNPDGETSLYYYGPGYYPESTVYALVTGKPGEGDGPKTTYLYEGATEAYLVNILRTADLDDGNGTITGQFNVKCRYSQGLGKDGYCQYQRMTTQGTTIFSTFNTTAQAQTTFTPVRGEIQRVRQSQDTHTLTNVAFPNTNVQNAAVRMRPLCLDTKCTSLTTLLLGSALAVLLAALVVL